MCQESFQTLPVPYPATPCQSVLSHHVVSFVLYAAYGMAHMLPVGYAGQCCLMCFSALLFIYDTLCLSGVLLMAG